MIFGINAVKKNVDVTDSNRKDEKSSVVKRKFFDFSEAKFSPNSLDLQGIASKEHDKGNYSALPQADNQFYPIDDLFYESVEPDIPSTVEKYSNTTSIDRNVHETFQKNQLRNYNKAIYPNEYLENQPYVLNNRKQIIHDYYPENLPNTLGLPLINENIPNGYYLQDGNFEKEVYIIDSSKSSLKKVNIPLLSTDPRIATTYNKRIRLPTPVYIKPDKENLTYTRYVQPPIVVRQVEKYEEDQEYVQRIPLKQIFDGKKQNILDSTHSNNYKYYPYY